jgi:hypothetical protein
MTTTGIRIEVSQDFYLKLLDEQNKQKSLTGRKPALADIILNLCQKGIKYQNEKIAAQQTAFPAKLKDQSNDPIRENTLAAKEKELLSKEKELRTWEAELREREFDLIEKSKTINETAETLMEQRNDIYDQKETLQEKSHEPIILKIQKESLEREINSKNLQMQNMQQELNDLRRNVYKTILNIDRKTESNIFMKFIMPALPLIAVFISTLILKDKLQSEENLSQAEKDILKSYNELDPKDQEEINKYLRDILNKGDKV